MPLGSHDMKDQDNRAVKPVENPTWWLDDLAMP